MTNAEALSRRAQLTADLDGGKITPIEFQQRLHALRKEALPAGFTRSFNEGKSDAEK